MAKSGGRTKKVRYVATVLTKYKSKEYAKYSAALPKAREIYSDLQKSGSKVTVSNILSYVRKKRVAKKSKVPKIYSRLLESRYYFELIEYPIYITRTTNEVWFKSKLFPEGAEDIQGGSTPSYNDYFAPFVAYINSLKGLSDTDDKLYETEWNVRCTEPIFNKKTKRWESEIISVDGTGDRFDYGFDPKNPQEKPQELLISQQLPAQGVSTTKEPEVKPTAVAEARDKDILEQEVRKKEADVELKRQENISNLLKLFGEGQLSKAEFKELMNKIK